MRIAVDLMGSDTPPEKLMRGVLEACQETEATIETLLLLKEGFSFIPPSFCEVLVFSQEITMEDSPLESVRRKKDSTLVQGLKLLADKKVDAFITAGNTGALIAGARLHVPLLPGIDRPALLAFLPTLKGPLAVIDVGGNVHPKVHHLIQFSQMGAEIYRRLFGVEYPRIGLLNIGVESTKGPSHLQEVYQILKKDPRFVGNIEGKEVFSGVADVLVTDGFTGNIFLKTAEGASAFVFENLSLEAQNLRPRFSHDSYPGALVCGIEGIALKCHGSATAQAFKNAFLGACSLKKTLSE